MTNKENFISFSDNNFRSLQSLTKRKLFSYLAFYKQKIRIFTSSIYDTSRSSGHMFFSYEDAAARISVEVALEDCTKAPTSLEGSSHLY